jgi:hypothetical protein
MRSKHSVAFTACVASSYTLCTDSQLVPSDFTRPLDTSTSTKPNTAPAPAAPTADDDTTLLTLYVGSNNNPRSVSTPLVRRRRRQFDSPCSRNPKQLDDADPTSASAHTPDDENARNVAHPAAVATVSLSTVSDDTGASTGSLPTSTDTGDGYGEKLDVADGVIDDVLVAVSVLLAVIDDDSVVDDVSERDSDTDGVVDGDAPKDSEAVDDSVTDCDPDLDRVRVCDCVLVTDAERD